jgi:hypothetical protein
MTPKEEKTYWNMLSIPVIVLHMGAGTFFLTMAALSHCSEFGFYAAIVTAILFLGISAHEIYHPYR